MSEDYFDSDDNSAVIVIMMIVLMVKVNVILMVRMILTKIFIINNYQLNITTTKQYSQQHITIIKISVLLTQ